MTKLSVNVNKLATLRNSRAKNLPDVARAGRQILEWGAHGLTVHPRPDGRHIRTTDVPALAEVVLHHRQKTGDEVEFNVEGYPSPEYLDLIEQVRPDQATLVPDPPDALTSNAGWRVEEQQELLRRVVAPLHKQKVRVSVFVDPAACRERDLDLLVEMKVQRIELYTEAFADAFGSLRESEVTEIYVKTARQAVARGLELNAGHDLNQANLGRLVTAIPQLAEVSIGHALICEALYEGLETTVQNYLRILRWKSPSSQP